MKSLRFLAVGIAVLCAAAIARADTLEGRVVDPDGEPVSGASILRGDRAAVSAEDGRFTIDGSGAIMVSADGYSTVVVPAKAGVVVHMPKADGEVIEVTGNAPEEAKPLAYEMSAHDIASTPGAMNDALRAITILPAAARIPFSFGGIVLRGMSPRDSSVFVDGVEIPIAYHFGGITGVFPTQALQDMKVVPSGFDVSLGRTQGGVVELTSRRPRDDFYRIGGEVSLLHSLVSAEGPAPAKGAFLVTLRRSYLDAFIRPLVTINDPLPSYTDGMLRMVWGEPAKRRGELSTYFIGSLDRVANSPDAAKPNDDNANGYQAINLGFVRMGASYKRKIARSLWTVAPTAGTNILSFYTKDYGPRATKPSITDISRRWYLFGGRAEWLRDDAHGFVRAGLDVEGGYLGRVANHNVQAQDSNSDFPVPRNTVLWTNAAVFAETRRQWYGDRLSVRPGLRIDREGLGNETTIDPRVNAHATLSPTSTLRASLGRFHQPPSPAHFDEFADNLNAKSSYVDQGTIAVEVAPQAGLLASVTGFYHEGRKTLVDIAAKSIRPTQGGFDLVFQELLEEQVGLYAYQDNLGRERSYGIETAVRFDTDSYRLMANFAWSRAKRRYEPARGRGWEPYGLDQPLRLNLLAATTAREWNFGGRLTVVSGNPLRLVPEGTPDQFGGEPPTVLQRLPTFWQLDFRIDRTWKKSWGQITGFADLQNVTNHRNVEYRDSQLGQNGLYHYEDVHGLPIIPYIGVEFAPR